jgi:hypothetical protein
VTGDGISMVWIRDWMMEEKELHLQREAMINVSARNGAQQIILI